MPGLKIRYYMLLAIEGRVEQNNTSSGGIRCIYLCCSIHKLINVLIGDKNNPLALFIRSIIPIVCSDEMIDRPGRGKSINFNINDPRKLSIVLGINLIYNGISLDEEIIWFEDRKIKIRTDDFLKSARPCVQHAGKDTSLPYRLYLQKKLCSATKKRPNFKSGRF